jgi:GNAT superfamily N-acetyltransferase
VNYQIIEKSQSEEIAKLSVCLTNEIIERTGIKHFDVDVPLAIRLCDNYVSNGLYNVIAAYNQNEIVGFGALCESHSLYAEGAFGIIQEFYVMPEYRSKEIGKELIREIIKFAEAKKWKRLELCTPPVPEFNGTVDFYQTNGFEITGGHKMKYTIA